MYNVAICLDIQGRKKKRNETKEETNKRERRKNSKSNVTYII